MSNVSIKCITKTKKIMNNKEHYAKLFSEGRESLEKLLLTCYDNNIMTQACCAGHIQEDYLEPSYLYIRLNKNKLKIISEFIKKYKESNLREIASIEESIQLKKEIINNYMFNLYTDYINADYLYLELINLINNTTYQDICIEYKILELFKKELNNFMKENNFSINKIPYEASSILLNQVSNDDLYEEPGNYLKIVRTTPFLPKDLKTYHLDDLINILKKDKKINYTDLIATYKYESDEELNDLYKVLIYRKK